MIGPGNEFRTAQRQHVNISNYANKILCSDALSFMGSNNMSGFINAVFLNFYQNAEASLSLASERLRTQYINDLMTEKYISRHPLDPDCQYYDQSDIPDETELRIIDDLVSSYIRKKKAAFAAYEKQHVLKVRLQNNVFDIIYGSDDSEWSEAAFYRAPCDYLKAILEEYTRKTYYEREAIFLKTRLDILNAEMEAIDSEKRILTITYADAEGNRVKYNIKPHFITNKPLSEYHFLLAMATEAGANKSEYKPHAFRICWITEIQIRPKSFGSGRLTKAQKDIMERLTGENGAPYLDFEARNFKLELTRPGLKKYYKIAHLRPLPEDYSFEKSDADRVIMNLHCTEQQIKYYFFKLGSDVKILEPEDAARRFREDYKKAYLQYADH